MSPYPETSLQPAHELGGALHPAPVALVGVIKGCSLTSHDSDATLTSLRRGRPRRAPPLKRHHKKQLEEKLKAGGAYEDSGLVFATAKGTPLDAQNVVNRHFKPLLA